MALDLAAHMPAACGPTGVFAVEEIPDFVGHYVGRDDVGHACLLLGSSDEGFRAPIRLGGLEVQYALECEIRLTHRRELRERLTIVRCTLDGTEAERYFLHVMGTLVCILGVKPTLQRVAEAVTRLAAIFQRLNAPARENVAGVVGELLVIALAGDPVAAVDSWRVDVDERYDFVYSDLRLEAKSSMTRRRVHSWSFEQAAVPPGCVGVVASIFVEKSAGGTSLESLIDLIGERLASEPASILQVEQTLADTLGTDLPDALTFSFDLDCAIGSLAFYDMAEMPAVRGNLAPGVTQVRFTSDLSASAALDAARFAGECEAFLAFLPTDVADIVT